MAFRLVRFFLRYYPPGACHAHSALAPGCERTLTGRARATTPAGVVLEYQRSDGTTDTKVIDLLQLTAE